MPGAYTFSDLTLGTNCQLIPLGDINATNEASGGTAGSKHGIGVAIRCASARIDGTVGGWLGGLGFPLQGGPGYEGNPGYGAAYGGCGGGGNTAKTYGQLGRPTALGSGGYSGTSGGAFKLRVDGALALGGTIDMAGSGDYNGAGSGGSVWLIAGTLSGNGSILANGGASGTPGSHQDRGGGGGRVALEYGSASTFTGVVNVALGPYGLSTTGSLFRCQSVSSGASDDAGAAGVSLATTFSTNSFTNGVIVTRSVTEWKTWGAVVLTWTDRSMDAGSNQLNNVATYGLSGLVPNQKFHILDNGVAMFGGAGTNSGSQGVLQFTVTLDAAHTIQVQGGVRGTVISIY